MRLDPRLITADRRAQSRLSISDDVVASYAEAMREGVVFPPVVVFRDGNDIWLADGFHRHAAALLADVNFEAEVREGDLRAAILYSVGANGTHGLQRSNEDKRKAVRTLLDDPEWVKWSDREIAKRCAVSNDFVSRMRRSLSSNDSDATERTYIDKHGNVATMDTSGIGRVGDISAQERAAATFQSRRNWADLPHFGTCAGTLESPPNWAHFRLGQESVHQWRTLSRKDTEPAGRKP